jgi:hypothetical protein
MSIFRESIMAILTAPDAVSLEYPTDYYLDPVEHKIRWYTRKKFRTGVPREACNGIWVDIFQAPPKAIRESIVGNLLRIEDLLVRDCKNNFFGISENGLGIWKRKPNYGKIEIATYLSPEERFFGPYLEEIKRRLSNGENAEDICRSLYLGDIFNGIVRYEDALNWIRKLELA